MVCFSSTCECNAPNEGVGRTVERELAFVSYQQELIPFSIPVCITFESEPTERKQPETNNT